MRRAVLVLVAAMLGIGSARASVFIAGDVARPALHVDAKGDAEVTWAGGSVLVPPRGQLFHGGGLSGPDVSRPVALKLALAVAVRRTPDGRLWALQRWQAGAGGPLELHLARWTGTPTALTLTTDGKRLSGTVSFGGKPVTGTTFTLEGKRPRIYVYLDCFGCPGSVGWKPLAGVPPRADGSFSVFLRPDWVGSRYRASVEGPNVGTSFAPDAQVVTAAVSRA